MTENNRNIEQEIDLMLQSLDGIKPAEANPFLYEKIMNRMNTRKRERFIVRYKYAFVSLLIILINVLTLTYFSLTGSETTTVTSTGTQTSTLTRDDKIKNLATEYSIISNTYNY